MTANLEKRARELVKSLAWADADCPEDEIRLIIALLTQVQAEARLAGQREGVTLYAWWKDGTQYVGTTGRTLKEALAALNQAAHPAPVGSTWQEGFEAGAMEERKIWYAHAAGTPSMLAWARERMAEVEAANQTR